jgi:mannose-6-phosphate isomerase
VRLRSRPVEKPWGRRDLGLGFPPVAGEGEPVGEIWFEGEADAALLVKYLFTSERLSIQVHPDDEAARALGEKCGKDEAWFVIEAEPDATIGMGLCEQVSLDRLAQSARDGSIERLLDWHPARAGDVFYSPAGTIHAIGGGLKLIEIQQNVDVTYRLYDYGRPRALHLEEALRAARPGPSGERVTPAPAADGRTLVCDGPAFRIERWASGASARIAAGEGAWLVPIGGRPALDGVAIEPGSVWFTKGGGLLQAGGEGDLLVAFAGPRA